MGDVKLLAVMGLYLGPAVIVALLLALLGSLSVGVVIARRVGVRAARKTQLPLGPFLAAGGIVAALVGDPLIHTYLHGSKGAARRFTRPGCASGSDRPSTHRPRARARRSRCRSGR